MPLSRLHHSVSGAEDLRSEGHTRHLDICCRSTPGRRGRHGLGMVQQRPIPQIPQLLQTLRGAPGAAIATPIPSADGSTPASIPRMVQPPPRIALSEPGRANAARPPPPNLSVSLFESSRAPALTVSATPSGMAAGAAVASSWESTAQAVARSVALRQLFAVPKAMGGASTGKSADPVRGLPGFGIT